MKNMKPELWVLLAFLCTGMWMGGWLWGRGDLIKRPYKVNEKSTKLTTELQVPKGCLNFSGFELVSNYSSKNYDNTIYRDFHIRRLPTKECPYRMGIIFSTMN